MSQSDDWEKRQEWIPKGNASDQSNDSGDGKEVATNLPWMVDYALNKSLVGLRIQKRKVDAHRELYEAIRLAQEELARLDDTPARMKQERKLKNADYAVRGMEFVNKTLQLDLDQNRILKEIQEQKDAKELLDLKKQLDMLELQVKIANEKKKLAELKKTSRKEQEEPDKPMPDPHIAQARDAMRQYMERHRDLGADKKKWFAQIDADLARGELSEEMAENMKEDVEQIIRDSLLKP
ncbi:MAG: hypothetical protein NHG36_09885 [Chromatiaceae bacterium]|nr:hypothetical protein [Candidatus Thioaporhodococcus sediminis]